MVDRRSVRCLVVDDDRYGAETVGAFLEILGAEVQVAYGGQEAIDIASHFQPRLVVLDLNMPNMDGFETCRRLRQQSWSGHAVFVAYTGLPYSRTSALAACFHHVVSKGDPPDVFETLLNELRN